MSMSFTSGALLYGESIIVAEMYGQEQDWDRTRMRILSQNLLQMRTENASKRIWREVSSRLKQLTPPQMTLLIQGSRTEQNYLLWLAICKRYRYIGLFGKEVLREKFLRLDLQLSQAEYEIFYHRKAEWYPEVANVAPVTQKKQRQIIFKILHDAGLLNDANQIVPALLTPALAHVIQADDPALFGIYPATDQDIRMWAASYVPS